MEQAIIRRVKDGTLAPCRELAKAKGRSLEAELRDLIERNMPLPLWAGAKISSWRPATLD